MRFSYKSVDHQGRPVADVIESSSIEEATQSLSARGLFVSEIVPDDGRGSAEVAAAKASKSRKGSATKRLKQVAMFSRQLQVLVSTGTPLADAMAALERQTPAGAFREVLGDIKIRVEEGTPLSEAMSAHPKYFDRVYRNIIEAGESASAMDTMLDRLSLLTRKQAKLRTQVTGAMAYPAALIFISTIVLIVMLTLVLPRFAGLFETLDVPLPATTEALMWASVFLRSFWWALLIVLIGAGAGIYAWGQTPNGQRQIDRWMISTPRLSLVTRSFATARIARLLGVLVECNVPLLEAIKLSRHASGNSFHSDLMVQAEEAVVRGEPMSVVLSDDRLIDPALYEAVRNGEQSGKLGVLLITVADFMDEENDVRIKSLTSLLEPLILVVLGVMVGGMAISMFLPLFDLTAGAGGAG